jgi:hypothetical protein
MTDREKEFENLVRDVRFDDKPDYNHRENLEQKLLAALDRQSQHKLKALKTRRFIMKDRITKLAVAAAVIVAVSIGINYLGGSIDGASVAWADVVEQFNSIAFFNASVYLKENSTDEPIQIELWRNSQKKARIRADSQVLFADGGQVVAGYAIDGSIRKIETEEYNEMGMAMAQQLFSFQEFSLDMVISAFGVSKDRVKETTPLINPAAMISEDLLVFDLQSDISPEWMRIWVLRESRLPIRIRSWDPRDGDCVDVVMSYSAEQSAEFFDPEAYEQILLEVQQDKGTGGRTNLAYALLDDPGGKAYTPKDLFEKAKLDSKTDNSTDISGYHLPIVERAGVTEYGAVWVVASKSQNRKPDGRTFYGFSDISDDLKREYRSADSVWFLDGDVSVDVFVPENYPFDTAKPKELTLRCSVEATGPYQKEILVGNVKLYSWQENTIWPQNRIKKDELQMIIRQAWTKTDNQETCQKILELVQQLDTDNKHSHEIEKIKLHMLIKEKNYHDAALLSEKLLPAEFKIFKNAKANANFYEFYDYIVAIAANGDVRGATDSFNEIKQLKPDLSPYNDRAKKHIMERLARQINGGDMYNLIQSLFTAGLDLEQVNQIVGFDVLENENTKWYVPDKFRRQRDPHVIKQKAYLKKLTEKYMANPLEPGQMVLNKCKLKEIAYMGPVPEVKDHYFYVFGRDLHKFLKGYKSKGQAGRVNRVQIADGIENPMLQHEIIYNSPKGFLRDECREFLMSEFGLEAIESQATETVLVAEYDGSQRKDYRDVRCPAIRGDISTLGMMSFRSSPGISLRSVLDSLAREQEMMVINNTGIEDKTIITQEVANFKTAKGMELAEKWYKDNFGITFRQEQRCLPIWIVRKIE